LGDTERVGWRNGRREGAAKQASEKGWNEEREGRERREGDDCFM
jgi:hypothetical protein